MPPKKRKHEPNSEPKSEPATPAADGPVPSPEKPAAADSAPVSDSPAVEAEDNVQTKKIKVEDEVVPSEPQSDPTSPTVASPEKPAAAVKEEVEEEEEEEEDDEPVRSLIEPFDRETLAEVLEEAAKAHPDVRRRIRRLAEADVAHRKIFVHGLGWDATTESLATAFVPYGEIEECKVVAHKPTGKSKGYGFVLFKRRAAARRALKEPQKHIGGRMTACQLASAGPAPAPASFVPESQRKIYVTNVGADVDPARLLQFFAKFGEVEEGPLGLDKATGKPRGFALFVYKTTEGLKKALEAPHKTFEGRTLTCQKAIDSLKYGNNRVPNNPVLRQPAAAPASVLPYNQMPPPPHTATPLGQAVAAMFAGQPAGYGFPNFVGVPPQAGLVNPANSIMGPGYPGQQPVQGGGVNAQVVLPNGGSWQPGFGNPGGVVPFMGQ